MKKNKNSKSFSLINNNQAEAILLAENEFPQLKEHKRVYLVLKDALVPNFVIEKKVDGWTHTGFVKEVDGKLVRHGAGLWESKFYEGEDMYSNGKLHGYSIFWK